MTVGEWVQRGILTLGLARKGGDSVQESGVLMRAKSGLCESDGQEEDGDCGQG